MIVQQEVPPLDPPFRPQRVQAQQPIHPPEGGVQVSPLQGQFEEAAQNERIVAVQFEEALVQFCSPGGSTGSPVQVGRGCQHFDGVGMALKQDLQPLFRPAE